MTNDEKLDFLVSQMQSMHTTMQDLHTTMRDVQKDIRILDKRVSAMENEVRGIQVTLENVTNRNIRMIAEGHIGLAERLDDALKINHERELLLIRVNVLEDEVKRIKEKLSA